MARVRIALIHLATPLVRSTCSVDGCSYGRSLVAVGNAPLSNFVVRCPNRVFGFGSCRRYDLFVISSKPIASFIVRGSRCDYLTVVDNEP